MAVNEGQWRNAPTRKMGTKVQVLFLAKQHTEPKRLLFLASLPSRIPTVLNWATLVGVPHGQLG